MYQLIVPILSLPEEIQGLFEAAERTAVEHLQDRRFAEAERIYANQLAILQDLQRRTKKRFHKGGPLHNLGISLLLQGNTRDGVVSVLLALIEDVLSAEVPFFWRDAPAYVVLRRLGLSSDWLNQIEGAAERTRELGTMPRDPEAVLRQIGLDRVTIQFPSLQVPERLPYPQPPKKVGTWVFIGGSFKTVVILRQIKQIVRRRGHFPILLDYPVPPWLDPYDISVAALDQCEYAVFEVTIPEGQMAEVIHHYERWIRSSKPDPQILLLIQELFGSGSPRKPAMIPPRYKSRCKRYRVLSVATRHVNAFLP